MKATGHVPVLFIMPPGGVTTGFPEHLGTAYLRAMLHQAGIASRQYLPPRNPGLNEFAAYLRETRPCLVGFTMYETNLLNIRAMVQTVRATLPEAVVLIGGPNATFSPEETLELTGADGCFRGAAEGQIVPLTRALIGRARAGRPLTETWGKIRNLVLRTAAGPFFTPAGGLSSFPAEGFRTLDDVPSPFQAGLVETTAIGYLSSRGCDQHCTYCSFAAISGRQVRLHGTERVLDDLAAIQALFGRTGATRTIVPFMDDAFTLDMDHARRICEGVLQLGIRLSMMCITRADHVDLELLRLLKQAGFVSIAFGLESAVPRVLRAIGKVCPPKTTDDPAYEAEKRFLQSVRQAVHDARLAGLDVAVSIMGGLPQESPADFQRTLDFVGSLAVVKYTHNVLEVFPGTVLYRQQRAHRLQARRDKMTMQWKTVHPFDARQPVPQPNSSLMDVRWESARRLSDALCGRPRPTLFSEEALWTVIVRSGRPSARLMAWLRKTLAIDGTLIVMADGSATRRQWAAMIARHCVPVGELVFLCLPSDGPEGAWTAYGNESSHRVRFVSEWDRDEYERPIRMDERGDCQFSVWRTPGEGAGRTGRYPLAELLKKSPALQIADSCRWWGHSPRCGPLRLAQVDSAGNVYPCWRGPCIGSLRQGLAELRANCRSLIEAASSGGESGRRRPRCPLSCPGEGRPHPHIQEIDLVSQLAWLASPAKAEGSHPQQ